MVKYIHNKLKYTYHIYSIEYSERTQNLCIHDTQYEWLYPCVYPSISSKHGMYIHCEDILCWSRDEQVVSLYSYIE